MLFKGVFFFLNFFMEFHVPKMNTADVIFSRYIFALYQKFLVFA